MARAPHDARDPAIERAHFDGLVAAKGRLYWADRTPAGRRRQEVRAATLVARAGVGTGDRVLEIGCGTGEYSRRLAGLTQATVVSIDVAPTAAAEARRVTGRDACVAAADVERLPFADATFAAVLGNAVLHHLRLEHALPELLRVLRPGGRFCFAEPNLLNPHVFIEKSVPWIARRLDDSPGETAFTRWRLRRDLEAAGLVEISVEPFDFLYPLVPGPLVPAVERIGRILERAPVVREIAGSLMITARRRA